MGAPLRSLNLCNLPPWILDSLAFNDHPQRLEIQGVRAAHAHFFKRVQTLPTWEERASLFQDYMDVAFHLHQWRGEDEPSGRLSLKNSYLRFLRGWLFDSNSVEGAVLKGWVESRLGMPPTYHRGPLGDGDSETHLRYLADRMNGSTKTNAIQSQLDLLYEFTQHELALRHPEQRWLTLYRGVHDFSEHTIHRRVDDDTYELRLNNLNSFTRDFERAWEFGSKVMEVQVPLAKVFFDGSFLHAGILRGEEEVLVIGGLFRITLRRF